MTTREVIQAMSRDELERAFTNREDQLAKALEAEKLARAGFDKAALERDQLKEKVAALMKEDSAWKERFNLMCIRADGLQDQLATAQHKMLMLKNQEIGIDESYLLLAEKIYPGYNWRYHIGEGWLKGEEGRNDSTILALPPRQYLKHLEERLAKAKP